MKNKILESKPIALDSFLFLFRNIKQFAWPFALDLLFFFMVFFTFNLMYVKIGFHISSLMELAAQIGKSAIYQTPSAIGHLDSLRMWVKYFLLVVFVLWICFRGSLLLIIKRRVESADVKMRSFDSYFHFYGNFAILSAIGFIVGYLIISFAVNMAFARMPNEQLLIFIISGVGLFLICHLLYVGVVISDRYRINQFFSLILKSLKMGVVRFYRFVPLYLLIIIVGYMINIILSIHMNLYVYFVLGIVLLLLYLQWVRIYFVNLVYRIE